MRKALPLLSLLPLLPILSLALLLLPAGAEAHHAFAAEFDRNQPIELSGTVTKVEWMNPHARIYIDAPDSAGVVANWNLEMGSPNGLMRQGWRRDTLQPGDAVSITGWRARNHPHVGNIDNVRLPDGTRVFAASSANEGN
jgi:hypothetical protein